MISNLLPHLAGVADELCFLHGMQVDNPAHDLAILQFNTGVINEVRPSMGAWVSYGLGTENANLPSYISIHAGSDVRAHASPTPSPALPPVQWSADVEAVAQAWANNCVYQHNAGRGQLGENIAASTPGVWPTMRQTEGCFRPADRGAPPTCSGGLERPRGPWSRRCT